MSTVKDFIYGNNLQWQASFSEKTDKYDYGYRGSLVITPGKVLSADKQLPPKATATQVILVSNSDKIDFIACELETLDFFEPFVEQYKEVLSTDGLYILFVTDLDADGKFEYEGFTFYAFSLDESSVWNELLDHADLSKGDLKKLSAGEKIDTVYDEIKSTTLRIADKSYDDVKAAQSGEGRVLFGAV
ncbi:hypothetical protein LOH54_08225 [Sulfurimonas sp. HSL-3221]|uniref:hypothetical protein n=1 Tax=Sulfurimonadaceae TaxID=2771471 RepID=UPI001E28AA2F|nr:hypothetical protein [Sulfurimonas sp. HSL-3221]UFS61649.1 hypothetical protein LOH54_08225 [Sulfurimonas sp. HSL-3221]